MIKWEIVATIIVAIFGSQGFWSWLMSRNNESKKILDEMQSIRQEVCGLRDDFDLERTITARTRILHFNDELLNDAKHSKESFDQVLSDIDTYEKYCDAHPKFLNNRTAMSVSHIKRTYQKCEDEHSFL